MKKISKLARGVLEVLPDEGRIIKTSVRKVLVGKELALSKLTHHFGGMTLPDPRVVHWLPPEQIEFATCLKNESSDWEDWVFRQTGRLKRVHDGEWDLLKYPVASMRICTAIEGRMKKGEVWEKSEYYQVAVRQIEGGRKVWGCTNRADFDKHCNKIDLLIDSIVKHGYRESKEFDNRSRGDTSLGQSEVLINVSRDGFPLFQDGRHRLAIARVLGVKEIPVQIMVRHVEWQVFREFMHRMARGSGGACKAGFLYQMPIHFDLGDIPSEHGCEDRWNAISPHIPAAAETALDIGCNLGFFCHKLEDLGYRCFGIEYQPDIAYAARKISQAEKRRFKVVTGDVLAAELFRDIGTFRFGIVNALNIFHHFIKTETGYTRLREFMKRVRADIMFFEPHRMDEPQMQGAFSNPSPEEFVGLIKDWGDFRSSTPIYSAGDGRTIYKLVR